MSKHTKERQIQLSERQDGSPSVTATETETHVFSVLPLPSAAEFGAFEVAVPGTGDRILTFVEKQFAHRCKQEITQQEFDNNLRMTGVVVGFFVIVVFAIIAVIFALCDRQTEALAAIIAPMIAFAIAVLKYTTSKN